MALIDRIFFILIPCLLFGSVAFLSYLIHEKCWNQQKLFSLKNFNQGLIHLGFLVGSVIIFSMAN